MSNINDFVIKDDILKEYHGNNKIVEIPEGVKGIEEMVFSGSDIEKIHLPDSLQKIGDMAFMCCYNLKEINISRKKQLEIGSAAFIGCSKLVDKSGFLIIQNRLFTFFKDDEYKSTVIIPNNVIHIEKDALENVKEIEIPINCPTWDTYGTAKAYGCANSILNYDGSKISFRDKAGNIVAKVILATKGETEPKKNAAILSLRQKNNKFDFSGYDECWAKLGQKLNKILVALTRVQYPYELSEEMQETYENFLKKHGLEAGKILIDENNIEALTILTEKQIFSEKVLKSLVDYANTTEKTHFTAALLMGQHTIKQNPAPQKVAKTKSTESSSWKKPKPGTNLVGRYLGDETHMEFPLKVEGVSVKGIANTAGDTPENYKNIKSIVIPEGYTYIGNKAFAGCENLETISLPSTLKEIGSQAFADCKKLKEIFISKDISFVGKNVFSNASITTLIMETNKKRIPPHLFFGCHIENFVILGGEFRSSGNVFDYTGASAGAEYASRMYEGNFPNKVFTNHAFTTLDLKGTGGKNAEKIHSLSELDETIITNIHARELVIKEKSDQTAISNSIPPIIQPVKVDSIDFANSVFVLSGLGVVEDSKITPKLYKLGGIVKDAISATVNYLVVPNGTVVENSKIKKAIELQKKGKAIFIINLEELERHIKNNKR